MSPIRIVGQVLAGAPAGMVTVSDYPSFVEQKSLQKSRKCFPCVVATSKE